MAAEDYHFDFDPYPDPFDHDEDGYDEPFFGRACRRPQRSYRDVKCNRCGEENVFWRQIEGGFFRLHDISSGRMHECERAEVSDFDDLGAFPDDGSDLI